MANTEPKGCLAAILKLFGINLDGASQPHGDLPFRKRDDFLSNAELSFYRVLRLAVKNEAVVCPKVNLADIFFVSRPNENRGLRNKIDRKHVDFLLCNPNTMEPLVGLELDDSSHKRADRIERDQFVDSVFQAATLPLIHIPARAAYEQNALAAELAQYFGGQTVAAPPMAAPATGSPVCPKCSVPMVKRVASKGKNAGKQFWGCTNYPKCRETVQV